MLTHLESNSEHFPNKRKTEETFSNKRCIPPSPYISVHPPIYLYIPLSICTFPYISVHDISG